MQLKTLPHNYTHADARTHAHTYAHTHTQVNSHKIPRIHHIFSRERHICCTQTPPCVRSRPAPTASPPPSFPNSKANKIANKTHNALPNKIANKTRDALPRHTQFFLTTTQNTTPTSHVFHLPTTLVSVVPDRQQRAVPCSWNIPAS